MNIYDFALGHCKKCHKKLLLFNDDDLDGGKFSGLCMPCVMEAMRARIFELEMTVEHQHHELCAERKARFNNVP